MELVELACGCFVLSFGVLTCTMNPDFGYRDGCRALLVIFWKQHLALKCRYHAPLARRVS